MEKIIIIVNSSEFYIYLKKIKKYLFTSAVEGFNLGDIEGKFFMIFYGWNCTLKLQKQTKIVCFCVFLKILCYAHRIKFPNTFSLEI